MIVGNLNISHVSQLLLPQNESTISYLRATFTHLLKTTSVLFKLTLCPDALLYLLIISIITGHSLSNSRFSKKICCRQQKEQMLGSKIENPAKGNFFPCRINDLTTKALVSPHEYKRHPFDAKGRHLDVVSLLSSNCRDFLVRK